MSATQPPLLTPSAVALTGLVSEHASLAARIDERAGLTVVTSDPWSGTSALLASLEADRSQMLLVDARVANDTHDLATAIADAAISKFEPRAHTTWLTDDLLGSAAGRVMARQIGEHEIDIEGLQHGSGQPFRLLRDAFEIVTVLAPEAAVVVIDHLGVMLAAQARNERASLIAELRAIWQALTSLELVLVEHAGGPIGRALRDSSHPLFQAGEQIRIRRPSPEKFVSDLVITKPWTSVSSELLRAAAKVADGVPALTWRVVELGFRLESGNPEQDAFVGWQKLRYLSDPSSGRQWDQLRRLHRHALEVVAALSFDLPPFTIPAAGKTVSDALKRLSEVGVAWQPRSREWAIADPLLAAWARDHVPLWVRQRDARRRG